MTTDTSIDAPVRVRPGWGGFVCFRHRRAVCGAILPPELARLTSCAVRCPLVPALVRSDRYRAAAFAGRRVRVATISAATKADSTAAVRYSGAGANDTPTTSTAAEPTAHATIRGRPG